MAQHLLIAISGKSGCGNTTVSRFVASRLGIEFINYTFRSMAVELGIPLPELLKLAEADPSYDRRLDNHQVELARGRSCVVGSRLAMWLVEGARLRVYLRAGAETRAMRIFRREGGSLESVRSATELRDVSDRERYRSIYGIDTDDVSGADLVINTDLWSAEEVASIIVDAARSLRGMQPGEPDA